MLTYFPTPYPDEWWYSVICRYYIRNGMPTSTLFLRKFYEEISCSSIGILFPGRDCYSVISNLPEEVFCLKHILLEHTLLPYYLRFYPLEEKEKALETFLTGREYKLQNIRVHMLDNKEGIKFCPVCYIQDIAQYGEPYWHREHQIPLVSVCPKHGSQLCLIEISITLLKQKLFPLCQIPIPNTVNTNQDYANRTQDVLLSRFAYSVLTLPFETAPPEYNRLKDALQSSEFASADVHGNIVLDAKRFRQRCVTEYGEAEYGRYCYWSNITSCGLARICDWNRTIEPELYILVSALFGLTANDLFCLPTNVDTPPVHQALPIELQKSVSVDEKARALTPERQQTIKIPPKKVFKKGYGKKNKSDEKSCFVLYLTDEEWDILITAASICGSEGPISFVRTALLQEAEQIFDKMEGETEQ